MQTQHEIDRSLDRWLSELRGPLPIAVVMGATVNGLSFVRSLGRRGVPVLLIDSVARVGSYSRYAKSVAIPSGPGEADTMLALLTRMGEKLEQPGVLFATSDHYCVLVAEHEAAIAEHFRFLLPGLATLRSIVDKTFQYEIARQAGIPIPATFFPASAEELDAVAQQVSYPAILKPCKPDDRPASMTERTIKVMLANTPAELRAAYGRAAEIGLRMMVQEVVPGDDDSIYGYWGFWDDEGREVAWVTRRKLRQSPPHFGDGSLQITVEEPQIAELSRRLLRAFNYRGLCGIEFKRDARDGSYRLMELNPRTEAGNQLAISAGVDFPWIGYQYLSKTCGGSVSEWGKPFRVGVKCVNEEADLKAFLSLRNDGVLSLGSWLRSLRGPRAHAIGAWDDPWPILVTAGRIGRAAVRRAVARLSS